MFLTKSLFFFCTLMCFQSSTSFAAEFSVKFIRVAADQVDNQVLVRWGTDSEINNDYFTVQRSVDGGSIWQDVGIVDSSNNTPGSDSYKFFDENPIAGSITYRLRQTDFDGTYTYSFVAEVLVTLFTDDEDDEVQLYPNPSEDAVTIETENFTEEVNVQMMDLSGKLISVDINKNDNQILVRPVNKIYGMFFLMISDNNKTTVKKVKFE
jgi:type IX secretion system substrate protein